VLASLLMPALAACGGSDTPSAARTTTVWVDPPSGGAQTPTGSSTSGSTSGAPSTSGQTPIVAGKVATAIDSFDEAGQHFNRATSSRELAAFRSPSGNIFCRLGVGTAVCEVKAGRVAPPDPSICPPGGATTIGRLELDANGSRPVCNTDSVRDDSAPKLSYLAVAQAPGTTYGSGVVCLSEETGVTCLDTDHRHGFYIARGTIATF
jgi:hypothetical protein